MASLIVGHTTHKTVKIWIRGQWQYPYAHVELIRKGRGGAPIAVKELKLSRGHDYTGVLDFEGLQPESVYRVCARFKAFPWSWASGLAVKAPLGRVRTTPRADSDPPSTPDQSEPLRFLVGSCNLSNIKVNNVLAMVSGALGSVVMQRALRHGGNTGSRENTVKSAVKGLMSMVMMLLTGIVALVTGYRQPPPPFVASPFLRLAALCNNCRISFRNGECKPTVGTIVRGEESEARGIVVFEPTLNGEPEHSWENKNAQGMLVVFRIDDAQFLCERGREERLLLEGEDRKSEPKVVGIAVKAAAVADRQAIPTGPAFMLHVGDQIYIDFPSLPKPSIKRYRTAYREAWIEDDIARRFLAQCPQYMTLDDHEIFNNFARDALPQELERLGAPRPWWRGRPYRPEQYTEAALQAYREYVHARHPRVTSPCPACGKAIDTASALYYTFDHGSLARFFVLDTRSERYLRSPAEHAAEQDRAAGQIISCCQMHTLKHWLKQHDQELLFIVSSVPFVAEVYSTADAEQSETENGARSTDKWSAPEFSAQREEIIRFLYDEEIARVVFLTGDMHCCYHASMKVGTNLRSVTIHELAGGPIYQLRYGEARDFYENFRNEIATSNGPVPYSTRMQELYSQANAVMHVSVGAPHWIPDRTLEQTIHWKVIPTVAEPGRPARRDNGRTADAPYPDDPVMTGRFNYYIRCRR